jgi:hypothetical protein
MAALVMAIGTGISAYGQMQQGAYQNELLQYNAQVNKINAEVAQEELNRQAGEELQAGAQKEAAFRKKAAAMEGTNIKNIALSGINLKGSPLLVMNDIAEQTELEAYGIHRTAQINAASLIYRGKLAAAGLNQQSAMDLMAGQNASQQGWLGAAATLMQGGSRVYGNVSKPNAAVISNASPKISGYVTGMNN